ncbi:MAG: hypothetical protein QM784_26005 [Polyangiaceae bacterium]
MALRITASPILCVGENPEPRAKAWEPPSEVEARIELAPPSTAPSVVSVRPPRVTETRTPLAWLGEQARNRPLMVAMGASLGSILLVFLMLGAVRLGRAFEGRAVERANAGRRLDAAATASSLSITAMARGANATSSSTAVPETLTVPSAQTPHR